LKQTTHPYLILTALWLIVVSVSSQVLIIAPILPFISAELGVSASLQGGLISAYAVMAAAFALFAGPFSDAVGRRKILLFGAASMTAALLLHGVVENVILLFMARALAGLGAGLLSGAPPAYIGDYFPYEKRGWANGLVQSGQAISQLVGIPAGILLAETFGFKATFLMFACTMGTACLLIYFFVPQPDVERDTIKIDLSRILEKYRKILQDQTSRVALLSFFLMFFSLLAYVTYLPTWLRGTLGLAGKELASLFFFGGLATVIAVPLAGIVSDRIGRKPILVISSFGLAIIMLATPYILKSLMIAYILFFLAMTKIAMRISPHQSLLTSLSKSTKRGSLMSLNATMGQLGVALGSAIAGPLYAGFGYVSNAIFAGVLMLGAGFIIVKYLPEPKME